MSLFLTLVLTAQAATPMPFVPPLRSRSMVEISVPSRQAVATLDMLARTCAERNMATVQRTDSQLVCASEPDAASRLAYMSARPRPSGPLEGYVRFKLQRSGESVRVQGVRYAEFRTISGPQQVVSDDTALLREMFDRIEPQRN